MTFLSICKGATVSVRPLLVLVFRNFVGCPNSGQPVGGCDTFKKDSISLPARNKCHRINKSTGSLIRVLRVLSLCSSMLYVIVTERTKFAIDFLNLNSFSQF